MPLILLLTEGQMNDHKGAKLVFDALPSAPVLIGDKGYDSDEFRDALASKGIKSCIPSRTRQILSRSLYVVDKR